MLNKMYGKNVLTVKFQNDVFLNLPSSHKKHYHTNDNINNNVDLI